MVYLLAVSLLWAFSFGIIGSRLSGLDSNFVAATRLGLAWLCFLPFVRIHNFRQGDLWKLAGIGSLQFGVMYTCYIRAFSFIPSHLVALFSILTPLYIAIACDLIARQWRWKLLLCASLSVLGAAIIKYNEPSGDFWIGFGLMQIANLAFGLGQLFYRQWKLNRPQTSDTQAMPILYAGGAAFAGLGFLIWGDFSKVNPSGEQWFALLYLGLIASGIGFYLWNKGAAQTQPAVLATCNNAVVPLAMAASLFVFGEAQAVDAQSILKLAIGGALIFASIAWGQKMSAPTKDVH